MCVPSCFSRIQLCATLACQAPLSMGFSRSRILQWVAMPSSRESSWPRDQTHISGMGRKILYRWAARKPSLDHIFFQMNHQCELSKPRSCNPYTMCMWDKILGWTDLFKWLRFFWVSDLQSGVSGPASSTWDLVEMQILGLPPQTFSASYSIDGAQVSAF